MDFTKVQYSGSIQLGSSLRMLARRRSAVSMVGEAPSANTVTASGRSTHCLSG